MKKTILFFLFLSFTLSIFAQNQKNLFTAPWGVQTYTFRNSFPKGNSSTLDAIKTLGFTEIEGNNPKGMTPEEFKKACDERGFTIPSTGGDYAELVKDPMPAIKKAKIYGSKYIMCAWIPHTKGAFSLENAKKAVTDFNAIGKVMAENGLTFCYHAHGYEFQKYGDGTLLDYIIQNTNPKYVSFEMDVLWITHGGGDPVALLNKYGNRWKLMHVKDLKKGIVGDGTGGTPAENDVPVGEGQANWQQIIKIAKQIGIKHFFIEDESNKEFENIPKSMAYLQSLKEDKAPISQPLVSHIYTADPSAHVFNDRIYIYPSHDIDAGTKEDDEGGHFDMKDYHILSMDKVGGKVTDHGVALDIKDVPWAGRQMWAPDAVWKNGTFYLYFPVKDKEDIFRIGVATSKKPEGPFKAEPNPIKGSYSIDPSVFKDKDGQVYMYFGGIWGGQLQRWKDNQYQGKSDNPKKGEIARLPRVVKMSTDLKSFAEEVKEVKILDEKGNLFMEDNNEKRFFEASWVHKYKGKYYFSYSTGDTHNICYAIGDNPYGPFTYKGILLKPVQGWTNHHSIIQQHGKWYLFYHDVQLSGKTHLRNVKVTELKYNADGTIQTIDAYR
jgi:sugar phosphate isomerase/epimerase